LVVGQPLTTLTIKKSQRKLAFFIVCAGKPSPATGSGQAHG